ncbi:MAG: class IV adenylate cyclase [Candidatus Diapherotrites archaeon]|nr:class IV adenylate cyclase [Candidatus Diapherotrites archaeon]
MRETEVKILEIDRAAVIKRLKALGSAKRVFSARLENRYYDFTGSPLARGNVVLRLRKQGRDGILCVKRHRTGKRVKEMEEHEQKVDFSRTKKLLESLGLVCVKALSKRRERWQLGKIHFEFDQYLGKHRRIPEFLEIEANNEREVFAAAKALGFSPRDCLDWGADKLLAHYGLR